MTDQPPTESQPERTPQPMSEPKSEPTSMAEPTEDRSSADLLTIGLLVFFVSLLVIVATLLALPRIVG